MLTLVRGLWALASRRRKTRPEPLWQRFAELVDQLHEHGHVLEHHVHRTRRDHRAIEQRLTALEARLTALAGAYRVHASQHPAPDDTLPGGAPGFDGPEPTTVAARPRAKT